MTWEFDELLKQVVAKIKEGTDKELAELTKEFNSPIINLVNTQWISSNCADIMFINYTPLSVVSGGEILVNNLTLNPGDFVGISGNNGEINKDRYLVVFGAAATKAVVIKRLYTQK